MHCSTPWEGEGTVNIHHVSLNSIGRVSFGFLGEKNNEQPSFLYYWFKITSQTTLITKVGGGGGEWGVGGGGGGELILNFAAEQSANAPSFLNHVQKVPVLIDRKVISLSS